MRNKLFPVFKKWSTVGFRLGHLQSSEVQNDCIIASHVVRSCNTMNQKQPEGFDCEPDLNELNFMSMQPLF